MEVAEALIVKVAHLAGMPATPHMPSAVCCMPAGSAVYGPRAAERCLVCDGSARLPQLTGRARRRRWPAWVRTWWSARRCGRCCCAWGVGATPPSLPCRRTRRPPSCSRPSRRPAWCSWWWCALPRAGLAACRCLPRQRARRGCSPCCASLPLSRGLRQLRRLPELRLVPASRVRRTRRASCCPWAAALCTARSASPPPPVLHLWCCCAGTAPCSQCTLLCLRPVCPGSRPTRQRQLGTLLHGLYAAHPAWGWGCCSRRPVSARPLRRRLRRGRGARAGSLPGGPALPALAHGRAGPDARLPGRRAAQPRAAAARCADLLRHLHGPGRVPQGAHLQRQVLGRLQCACQLRRVHARSLTCGPSGEGCTGRSGLPAGRCARAEAQPHAGVAVQACG